MNENQYNNIQNEGYMGQPPVNSNQYNCYQGVNPMGQPPMNGNQYNAYQGVNPMGQPPMNGNQYNGYQGVNPMGQPLMNGNQYNGYQGVNPMEQPSMNGNFTNQQPNIENVNKNANEGKKESFSQRWEKSVVYEKYFRSKQFCLFIYFMAILVLLFTSWIITGIMLITGAILITPTSFRFKRFKPKTLDSLQKVGMAFIIVGFIALAFC